MNVPIGGQRSMALMRYWDLCKMGQERSLCMLCYAEQHA